MQHLHVEGQKNLLMHLKEHEENYSTKTVKTSAIDSLLFQLSVNSLKTEGPSTLMEMQEN